MKTKVNKSHLTRVEVIRLKTLVKEAVPPSTALRGRGEIAVVLRDRGFGVRAIARFLTSEGLSVSPAALSKFLNAHPKAKTK